MPLPTPTSIALLCGVVFLATLVRSSFGFGEALVAVPLLALRWPLRQAAPLAVLVSVTVAGVILLRERQRVHWGSAAGLLAATLAGLPCGLLLLTTVASAAVKLGLGAAILAYALWALVAPAPPPPPRHQRAALLLCGFAAGVLGGAYGMNGPPLVVYGSLQRWPGPQFRATLQAYFLPASLLGLLGFGWAGLLTPAVWRDYLVALPALALALPLGGRLHRRLAARAWSTALHAGLAAIALLLLVQAWRGW
ncbi:MAG TPA: sulfite exporter TauE/SafE family protein [Terriglobales bacterium]|nr:sulfite exporter TauE/SafE family protein [Terriglobales bacterium]